MRFKARGVVLSLLILLLLFANIKIAFAHNWWLWHWDRTGNPVVFGVWLFAFHRAEAEAALRDWESRTIIRFNRVSSHTNMSVFDSNYGPVWGGLASIESSSFGWWDCWTWCHIGHTHARYNTYYDPFLTFADIQGVFCQEIGHTFGLDHSDTGDCMGKGYYNNINVTGPHNTTDTNRYLPGGTHP